MKRGLRAGACVLALAIWGGGAIGANAATVPVYGQRSPLWARAPLGGDAVDTIGSAGCALTAVSMVQSALGYQTDPGRLNQWLTAHGGYIQTDLLLWRQAAAGSRGGVRWKWMHVPGMVPQLRVDDQDIVDRPSSAMVAAELDAGHLVVAEVRLYGGMHFVVITGHRGSLFLINDPWFADRTTLQARYGAYQNAVYSAQVYYRN